MRLLALLFLLVPTFAWSKSEVVLSTDVGNEIDDQWAIVQLLLSGHFDVRGMMSAQAPSLPAPSAHSSYKILVDEVENRLGMREHAPLLEGASVPLANLTTPQESDAMRFLIDVSKSYSNTHRLAVVMIGAATDVASAILADPSIVDRIEIVAMGFNNLSSDGGKEFNVENDPTAWQVILKSSVPVTIGSGEACRANLAMPFSKAAALLANSTIGGWLWQEYQDWYFRNVKPLRINDFSKPWIIWDIITLAYLEGMTKQDAVPRPVLNNDLSLVKGSDPAKTVNWITKVDSARLWEEFSESIHLYERTHMVTPSSCVLN